MNPPTVDGIIHPVLMPVPAPERQLTGRERVQALSRLARQALAASARAAGLALDALQKDEKGAPLPSNGVYWSLTHKSAMVGAVASAAPVGIDLEKIRPCNPDLFRRIADEEEWRLAPSIGELWFFRFWTAKEAVLKAVGKGLTGLSDCRISTIVDDTHQIVCYRESLWTVEHFAAGADHLAAVATSGTCAVDWIIQD